MDVSKSTKRIFYVLAFILYSGMLWFICVNITNEDTAPKIETLESELAASQEAVADYELEIKRLNRQLIKNGVIAREWRELYYDRSASTEDDDWFAREILIMGDPRVYTEPGSEFYHREGCERLGSVSVAINLSAAASEDMRPCPDCEPIVYEPIA